ncbi:MAG: RES family NAD+ phosphorylase [Actinobacteria bacterium]|nr:RES family NAD+ phosphorylase [Actinomycetota bacterium]
MERWDAGRVIVRCHGPRYHEREFNPTTHLSRFRPLVHAGTVVPTIYGAGDFSGAVSETVFHEVPVRGPNRRILRGEVDRWVWCEVAPARDLNLVALHGTGLRRAQVTHGELIECDAAHYADTVPWSVALHDAPCAPDGLCWRSRQHNDSFALMLFGTRVKEKDLNIVRPTESLGLKPGGDHVYEFAEAADIAIVT